ncbi:MAG TPA: aryl-sulfate sulfotransferase [Pirellulales bacterium]
MERGASIESHEHNQSQPFELASAKLLKLTTQSRIPPAWLLLGIAIWTVSSPVRGDDTEPSGVGVFSLGSDDPRAFQGFNLMSPLNSSRTYLFDMQGRVVRTWRSDCSPALCPYLLENGRLLRAGSIGDEAQIFGAAPGVGGRLQMFTWNGGLVWDFRFCNARQIQHHDALPLANGNVMMIIWNRKTVAEALAAGRRPELSGDDHLLVDALVEVKPTGRRIGEVVWEWRLWDHLVQDFGRDKPNYGSVSDHPELVDLNFGDEANADWTHANGVAYNAALDQVMLSVHHFNEFWIIDHSTTTAEAAGHTGGRGGKGGDLLYRWGNPRAYRAGTEKDQKLFGQHHAHWIDRGLPGEGHVLVFNNGLRRHDGAYSSVDEIALPVDSRGGYRHRQGAAYLPDGPMWSYTAPKKTDFYSNYISGAQRLPNGNTLICSGADGAFFEVTREKEIVWKFVNPIRGDRGAPSGFGPPPRPGDVLSPLARVFLEVSPRQSARLDELQREVDRQLSLILSANQQTRFNAPASGRGDDSYQPGQILPGAERRRLQLSAEQMRMLAKVQREVDDQLERILTETQRRQMKSQVVLPGYPPSRFDADADRHPPVADAFPPVSASTGAMPVFRVYRYAADHPALLGKDLIGGQTIEELDGD